MSIYEASITNPKKQLEFYKDLSEQLQRENKQLQKDIKNIIKILEKNCDELEATEEEFDSLDRWQGLQTVELEQAMLSYCGLIAQQKEFINYLEDEKDRLARECSQIYEDSLGHTRLVNKDIFDEINDVLQKYREIIGVSDEKK